MTQLQQEVETFEKHRSELLGTAANRYVLIRGSEIIGTYESQSDAIDEGYRRFGNVPFLVKHIVAVETPLNFVSGLVEV